MKIQNQKIEIKVNLDLDLKNLGKLVLKSRSKLGISENVWSRSRNVRILDLDLLCIIMSRFRSV